MEDEKEVTGVSLVARALNYIEISPTARMILIAENTQKEAERLGVEVELGPIYADAAVDLAERMDGLMISGTDQNLHQLAALKEAYRFCQDRSNYTPAVEDKS